MQINCASAETIYSSILRLISQRHGECVEARGLMLKYSLIYTRTCTGARGRDTYFVKLKNAADKDDESGGSGVS